MIPARWFVLAMMPALLVAQRPRVGVAFGGGSARGFAHVGVLRWFEEHHVPIDLAAGTSMGGLVGGAFAAGMSSKELADLLAHTDWDEMFDASAYRYKSIQRKDDARDYPSRLEFHVRRGVALPSALNNGQQVDLLLSRIAARYAGLSSFDSLPTPLRVVALDLRSGQPVVLGGGSLPRAMRATMSLPGIFPPVMLDGYVLVDGGAMNNVPADVVRQMGADVVVAVDVGAASDSASLDYSVFGLVNSTTDAMMRANTRRAKEAADIVIDMHLDRFTSFDWRRAAELAEAGYRATDKLAARLLPYAVEEAEWARYLAARAARKRTATPTIAAIDVRGTTRTDERIIRRRLGARVGRPLDVARLERDITSLSGLDRYETVAWDLERREDGGYVLVVGAHTRRNAPPIAMATLNVDNETSDDFTFQFAARLLSYDFPVARGELRVDAVIGTDPSVAAELRRPLGRTPFFVAAATGYAAHRVNFTHDDAVVAQYAESRLFAQVDAGIAPIHDAELRVGFRAARYDARVKVGLPGLPSLAGTETQIRMRGIYDSQDAPIVPSSGTRVVVTGLHMLGAPEPSRSFTTRSNDALTQLEGAGSSVWSWHHGGERLFVVGAGGTSFDGHPLPTSQFVLGRPFQLDAFAVGERRADHYGVATVGLMHVVGRLPEFLGGPIVVGGWVENGSAFDNTDELAWLTQFGVGIVGETLIGPALVGYSAGGGGRRFHLRIGRLFR